MPYAVLISLLLVGGCIVGDQLTTLTIHPDGSAELVVFRSNLHSTQKGEPGEKELAKYKEITMRGRIVLAAFTFLVALVGVTAAGEQLAVQPDKENMVASRLGGQWEPDAELTKRLGGRAFGRLTFTNDAAVATRIPAKYEKFFKARQIYMAGMMTGLGKEHPFVLIENKGNPHIVCFRERDGDPLGDEESFNVMLAVGKGKQDDLLFIGGDFNNQPFGAYRRVKADGGGQP